MASQEEFDVGELLDYLDNDVQLAAEMIDLFFVDVIPALSGVEGSFAAGDYEQLYEYAHQLKGASANIRAKNFCDFAQLLASAAQGRTADCRDLVAEARERFTRAETALRTWQCTVQKV